MAEVIVRQPNGKWALYSTIIDKFEFIDATREEVVETLAEWARQDKARRVEEILNGIESGQPLPGTGRRTIESCMERILVVHGVEYHDQVEAWLNGGEAPQE